MKFLPLDETFFELFLEHIRIACSASELLEAGLRSGYWGTRDISVQMKTLEHQGDEVVRQVVARLQRTFVTPFDPEDIQALSTAIDDVLDFIENATFRIVSYRVEPIPTELIDLGQIVNRSCNCLRVGLEHLARRKAVTDACREIDQLEKEADRLQRRLIGDLFRTESDAIRLLKHKELFELLEAVTDRCDDVANILEKIGIKNG
jgi:predicted phosphate transport protein (TIGR00153 family)